MASEEKSAKENNQEERDKLVKEMAEAAQKSPDSFFIIQSFVTCLKKGDVTQYKESMETYKQQIMDPDFFEFTKMIYQGYNMLLEEPTNKPTENAAAIAAPDDRSPNTQLGPDKSTATSILEMLKNPSKKMDVADEKQEEIVAKKEEIELALLAVNLFHMAQSKDDAFGIHQGAIYSLAHALTDKNLKEYEENMIQIKHFPVGLLSNLVEGGHKLLKTHFPFWEKANTSSGEIPSNTPVAKQTEGAPAYQAQ
ncbi:MAG: hypothetical protein K0Q74_1130 [Gammaproteobacteria bacterium]|jgi:hypothetical protein|nr:hypothetical protein [Gammaproteobacteria bacterium]